jgi:hypothetical protein
MFHEYREAKYLKSDNQAFSFVNCATILCYFRDCKNHKARTYLAVH